MGAGLLHRNLHRETWRWSECQGRLIELRDSFPREEPPDPPVGQGWFDERAEQLCTWDGRQWVCIPTD